jgi:D-alanyl-D-alanine carboxypeptidase (penicillin-binding protein 5/6)
VTRLAPAVALLVTTCYLAGTAAAAAPPALPPAPAIDASAWLVENPASGEVLTEHNASEPVAIASITKLMTVLVVLDHRNLGDQVQVDPRVAEAGQESVGLRGGEVIGVRELLKAALIQSANDAADALALSVAPDFDAFAAMMNAKARKLGLTDSHFVRPDGLDAEGAVSSARDVTRLALAAMRNPAVRETVAERDDSIQGGRTLHTWNDLLGVFPGVIGVKTGHTSQAGWSQVLAAQGHGVTLYVTILGSPSRWQRNNDLQRLLVWGFGQYEVVASIRTDRIYAVARLPFGRPSLQLVAAKPFFQVARIGKPLTERVVAPSVVSLPVRRGQALGLVQVWSGKRLVGSRELVAARSVARPTVSGRVGWYARRTAHHVLTLFT